MQAIGLRWRRLDPSLVTIALRSIGSPVGTVRTRVEADCLAGVPFTRLGRTDRGRLARSDHATERFGSCTRLIDNMQKLNSVVAVYSTHPQAEEALRAFQSSGFDMKKLSIVGKDYHTEEHVIGFYNAGDRMKFWGKRGAFWGTFWGMLFGSALFLVPGVGHLLVLGPMVGWIVGALGEGALVGGLTALGAGLYSIGIPKDSILRYETALKADQFVVVANGTFDDVTSAKRILERTGALSVDDHRAAGAT
jgi:heat induced stress protein YflT